MQEHRLETIIGRLLQVCVLVAASLTAAAGALFLARHGAERFDYTSFHGEPSELRHVPTIFSMALMGSSRALIQCGLLLLVATPLARVALAGLGFLAQGDRRYAILAGVVLALLLATLLLPA